MTDLWTPTKKPLFKKAFKGKRIYIGSVLCVPIVISDYEIVYSIKSDDKLLLVLQIVVNGQFRMLWTESYKLINTIQQAEKSNRALPFYTKTIKSKSYYEFAKITEVERTKLSFK